MLKIWAPYRFQNLVAGKHIANLAFTFSTLQLVCNYPHFMLSYKFGYTRGRKFIFKHAFSLIIVPLALITVIGLAYAFFSHNVANLSGVTQVNAALSSVGWDLRFGTLPNFGLEIMNWLFWTMYITVGWHYYKQVFGCLMVYGFFDKYKFAAWEKHFIKIQLLSVALAAFLSTAQTLPAASLNPASPGRLASLGVTDGPVEFMAIASFALTAAVVGLFIKKWLKEKQKPGVNMLVAWASFFIWWHPWIRQDDFYLYAAPFFHSLQYLPFAYKLESSRADRALKPELSMGLRCLAIIAIGFVAFEGLPTWLDQKLMTPTFFGVWFFLACIAIFINVHHFFIDSVTWRFSDPEMRDVILAQK